VLPALPATRVRRPRAGARLLAALAALALALGATPARAFDVTIESTRAADGFLWADLRLHDLFPARVEESLGRGMPATLQFHAELWRHRTAWFDRMEGSFDAELRVHYDVWTRRYHVERRGAPVDEYGSLDSLRDALSRPLAVRVASTQKLQPGTRCYVVVTATLRPLNVEDVEEVEGWLSGEAQTKAHSGFGVITELPRSLFDAVRNVAGFGDIRARATSPDFEVPGQSSGAAP